MQKTEAAGRRVCHKSSRKVAPRHRAIKMANMPLKQKTKKTNKKVLMNKSLVKSTAYLKKLITN